jgi:high-affinity Fe2+/Pb2+ permease
MSEVILSIAVLAATALIWGGIRLMQAKNEVRKGRLMIIAALVLFANVLIIAWPQ